MVYVVVRQSFVRYIGIASIEEAFDKLKDDGFGLPQ
jgi:hypothetical protein